MVAQPMFYKTIKNYKTNLIKHNKIQNLLGYMYSTRSTKSQNFPLFSLVYLMNFSACYILSVYQGSLRQKSKSLLQTFEKFKFWKFPSWPEPCTRCYENDKSNLRFYLLQETVSQDVSPFTFTVSTIYSYTNRHFLQIYSWYFFWAVDTRMHL